MFVFVSLTSLTPCITLGNKSLFHPLKILWEYASRSPFQCFTKLDLCWQTFLNSLVNTSVWLVVIILDSWANTVRLSCNRQWALPLLSLLIHESWSLSCLIKSTVTTVGYVTLSNLHITTTTTTQFIIVHRTAMKQVPEFSNRLHTRVYETLHIAYTWRGCLNCQTGCVAVTGSYRTETKMEWGSCIVQACNG
jgi:hypothetical protein